MNTTVQEVKVLRAPRAVLSYPHLFVAYVNEKDRAQGKKPMFSCTLIFDAEAQATSEWAALKKEANRVALAEWDQATLQAMIDGQKFKSPFINGDLLAAKNPECAGKTVLRVKTGIKPGIVDEQVRPITDETKIYPGCKVIASLNAYIYKPTRENPAMGCGVNFGLRNIQFAGDGAPLGNRTRPEDDFVPLEASIAQGGADPGAVF